MSDISTINVNSTDYSLKDSIARSALSSTVNSIQKNTLKISSPTKEHNGVTFTVVDENTVTVNGTTITDSSSSAFIFINLNYVDNNTNSLPVGVPCVAFAEGDMTNLRFRVSWDGVGRLFSQQITFTVPETAVNSWLRLEVYAPVGTVFDNQTIKIAVVPKTFYDLDNSFQPYVPSNSELYEMIKSLQNGA